MMAHEAVTLVRKLLPHWSREDNLRALEVAVVLIEETEKAYKGGYDEGYDVGYNAAEMRYAGTD